MPRSHTLRKLTVTIEHDHIRKMNIACGDQASNYSKFIREAIDLYSDSLIKKVG
jgi:hypothetical protein